MGGEKKGKKTKNRATKRLTPVCVEPQDFITRYLKYKPASELTPAQMMNGNQAAGIPHYRPATSGDLVPIHGFLARPILGQKYWKAQQQTSTVTGKYLRPMCEIVAVSAGMSTRKKEGGRDPKAERKTNSRESHSPRRQSARRRTFCKLYSGGWQKTGETHTQTRDLQARLLDTLTFRCHTYTGTRSATKHKSPRPY